MTPKEKAKELVWKYIELKEYPTFMMKDVAKACALIAIDEVLHYSIAHGFSGLTEYYGEVKQEVEKV